MFLTVGLVAIAAEWLIYRRFSAPAVQFSSDVVVSAIVDTVVFATIKGDVERWSAAAVWDRVLERLWAVVVLSFIFYFVTAYGYALVAAGDLLSRIAAIPILLIAASLVFAEAVAVVVDEEQWWFLIVRALGTSIRTAWSGATLGRALTIFALELLPSLIGPLVVSAVTHEAKPSAFWSSVPLGIICSIPLDVLIVLAFFDASGYEPKHTCGE